MILSKASLHIFDFSSDIWVLSKACLNFVQPANGEFINKHIDKIMKDPDRKKAKFKLDSAFLETAKAYAESGKTEDDLVLLSGSIGQYLFDKLKETDEPSSCDFLTAEFSENEIPYIAIMIFNHKTAYTHNVLTTSDGPESEVIVHRAILSTGSKADAYAVVKLDDFSVIYSEKKRIKNGKAVYVLRDDILSVEAEASSREVIKAVSKAAAEVAEEHGANTAQAVAKARSFIYESSADGEYFDLEDAAETVFGDNSNMQSEFREKLNESKLPEKVSVDKTYAEKQKGKQKIKTDTGIEISFPADYADSSDYIEFINNPDGTISIELKNISKIINR